MKVVFFNIALLLVLLFIGLYLVIVNRNKPVKGNMYILIPPQQAKYQQNKRYIGYTFIIVSILLGIYFYYTGNINFTFLKAQMQNDCSSCKDFIDRQRMLRPYKESEYSILVNQAKGCDECSKQCMDKLEIAKQYEPAKVPRIKDECIKVTNHAVLAKQAIGRLNDQIKRKQVNTWDTYGKINNDVPVFDPFPRRK